MFVHGGGWSIGDKRQGSSQKGAHFVGRGWAFASIDRELGAAGDPTTAVVDAFLVGSR